MVAVEIPEGGSDLLGTIQSSLIISLTMGGGGRGRMLQDSWNVGASWMVTVSADDGAVCVL